MVLSGPRPTYRSSKERKIGLLLSGGFDSCIILSILCKHLIELNIISSLQVFTIGNENSSDVIYAKKHVEFLETKFLIDIHHHILDFYWGWKIILRSMEWSSRICVSFGTLVCIGLIELL